MTGAGAAAPSDRAPSLRAVLTVHKAGSMLLESVCGILAAHLGVQHHSQNGVENPLPLRWRFDEAQVLAGRTGLAGPLRFPLAPSRVDGPVIVHLRDPRDVLVSLYYAAAYSHDLDVMGRDEAYRALVREKGIDAFVRGRAAAYEARYRTYLRRVLPAPHVRLVLYETMIEAPREWAEAVTDWMVPEGSPSERGELTERITREITPAEVRAEDPSAHVRQRLPGDHRRKLRAETIALLDKRFADILAALDGGGGRREAELHATRGRTETS